MKFVLFLLSLLMNYSARAESCDCGIHQSQFDFHELLQQVNVIGEKDLRITYEKYAELNDMTVEAVYDKFNANNRIYCGDHMGSGNLVKGNIALTVAHIFYDQNCNPNFSNISDCYLRTIPAPGKPPIKYPIEKISPCVKWDDKHLERDNVAIKFKDSIAGAHPYPIRSDCRVKAGFSGINVAAAANNFGDPKRPPPNIGPGRAIDPDGGTFKGSWSSGHWSSGSGVVCDSKKNTPAIAGIVVAGVDDPTYNFRDYDPEYNFTWVIPINDEIIEKINNLK